MRQFLILPFIAFSFMALGQLQTKTVQLDGQSITFQIRLPERFSPNQTYPVAVGPSEVKGKDTESFYWKGIKNNQEWILIGYELWHGKRIASDWRLLANYLLEQYQVEGRAFHTVGFSANSSPVVELVLAAPDLFRSITLIPGYQNASQSQLLKAQHVKFNFICGSADTYWLRNARSMHEKLKSLGMESTLEIVEGQGHILYDWVGETFVSKLNKLR